jgi:hypothetical protein
MAPGAIRQDETTSAPAAPSARAQASPIPELPPVTSAFWFLEALWKQNRDLGSCEREEKNLSANRPKGFAFRSLPASGREVQN